MKILVVVFSLALSHEENGASHHTNLKDLLDSLDKVSTVEITIMHEFSFL